MELIYKQECFEITGAVMEVHSNLGTGFLEEVYQEALEIEFKKRGIPYEREKILHIFYKGEELKKFYKADFVCYDKIIVELKSVKEVLPEHRAQVINYLKATGLQLGLIYNFKEQSIRPHRVPYID
ncbi:MAG: GxxExxY protein [Muribaculaceae bacterium]|nr:GxxExxY protein [Muribaculaceae bacterium]